MRVKKGITRRGFLKSSIAGVCFSMFHPFLRVAKGQENSDSPLFWIKNIPPQPFYPEESDNHHAGIDALLQVMGENGLKFYRSLQETDVSGSSGMIQSDDVVLIKVNAQWKYRGCTNSDLIRGLIQAILDHPDGFSGEVVIFENGQGRGSLNCDNTGSNYPDGAVHANSNDENQSFLSLVKDIFNDPRLSSYLLDPIGGNFIGANDHVKDGYRKYENVSYPCFTTVGGNRVELLEGLWQGSGYSQNLKLINVPVLKIHDGSQITAALKHFYGIVSMSDGQSSFRHYSGLGETGGKMVVSVRTPVLNIIDAIWVSFSSLSGYPANTTFQANQILASQDPVALDYWAAKYIMYSITNNPNHLPAPGGIIDGWLTKARDIINGRGGLYDLTSGILVGTVTKNESEILPHTFAFAETVSALETPSGPANGLTDNVYAYKAGGAISSTGDPIQYLFDWGDGSDSGWLPIGTNSAAKSWASGGIYGVKVQARCANHTTITSPWSPTLSVTIIETTLFVVIPNGGDNWAAGSAQTIRWTYSGNSGSSVKIELLKGGVVNRVIRSLASKGTGGTGSCNWTIPADQPPGADFRIRVTSTTYGACTDTSDSDFTIAAPTIAVLSPNSGETWSAGSMQTIRWSYTGNPAAYMKVELVKGGVVNRMIASTALKGSGGTGSRNWTIPANQTPGTDYRIRVTSTTNGVYTDTSDIDFTIAAPIITVVSPNSGETWTAGSTQRIRWTYTGNPGSYVKIELLKGGVVNRIIKSLVSKGTGGSGSSSWLIPSTLETGTDYQIRVTSTSKNSYSDTSDSNFTINK